MSRLKPPQALLFSFALMIGVGTLLLILPFSSKEGLSLINSLFTATSAVCVTGLIVVDTAKDLTPFGQGVVLGLIQFGGLGIMTFGLLLVRAMGKQLNLRARFLLVDTLAGRHVEDFWPILKHMLGFTLFCEALGTLLLMIRFVPAYGAKGIWHAVFHSISAFCNAGFSTFSRSLMDWRGDPLVVLVTLTLVILGGMGFLVVDELYGFLRGRKKRPHLSLHTRVVLYATLFLLGFSFVGFFLLENSHSLASMGWDEKILSSLFQAVTPRTAGFNSVDYTTLGLPGLLLTMILMFVGASPGSTGGGVKTTTMTVFLWAVVNRIRGRERVHLLGRDLTLADIRRALFVVVLFACLWIGGTFALSMAETWTQPGVQASPSFLALSFESLSALGTVGLSLGVTATLSGMGKFILVILMYAGRLGPLTVALAMGQKASGGEFGYPTEGVMVG